MTTDAAHAIGFIGAGHVGTALAVGLARAGYNVVAVASRSNASAQTLAQHVPGCCAAQSPKDVLSTSDIVFLTVSDDAIATVAAGLPWRKGQAAVHCSGALSSEALQSARSRGATVGCFHPLQTFPSREGGEDKLAGSAFAVEGEGWLRTWLEEAARKLGGFPVYIKAEDRALYHASAILACGYVTTLLDAATGLWERLGFSREEGLRALLPLVRGTVDNLERLGTAQAATGPIIRGDTGTVRRHLDALAGRAPETLAVYRELGSAMVGLAQRRGSIDDGQAEGLRGLLNSQATVDESLAEVV